MRGATVTTPAARNPGWNPDNYHYAPVTVGNANSAGGQLMTGIGLIIAITVLNTNATAAARFFLRDGIDSTGPIIAYLGAAAGGSDTLGPCPPGIYFGRGLFLQDAAGTAGVTVTYIPLLTPLK